MGVIVRRFESTLHSQDQSPKEEEVGKSQHHPLAATPSLSQQWTDDRLCSTPLHSFHELVGSIDGRVEHVLVAGVNVPEGAATPELLKARVPHLSILGLAAVHNSPNTTGWTVIILRLWSCCGSGGGGGCSCGTGSLCWGLISGVCVAWIVKMSSE